MSESSSFEEICIRIIANAVKEILEIIEELNTEEKESGKNE